MQCLSFNLLLLPRWVAGRSHCVRICPLGHSGNRPPSCIEAEVGERCHSTGTIRDTNRGLNHPLCHHSSALVHSFSSPMLT